MTKTSNPRSVIERARELADVTVARCERIAEMLRGEPVPNKWICESIELKDLARGWRDLVAAELDALLGAPELFSNPEQLPDDAALLNALYAILPFEMQMQLGGDAVEAREGLRQWPKGKVLLPSPREDVPERVAVTPAQVNAALFAYDAVLDEARKPDAAAQYRAMRAALDTAFPATRTEEPKR